MIFVTAIFLALFFAFVFVALELRGRKSRKLKPATLSQYFDYAQKRIAPHLRYPALIFAGTALFFFQIWEAFLRFLLQRDPNELVFALGFVAVIASIVIRQKRFFDEAQTDLRLGRFTLVLLFVGFSALLNSWGTLIFIPWIWFRASFLPARLG
jgi:asparagine N-glycosylation enzyme membrane subunit Stt3